MQYLRVSFQVVHSLCEIDSQCVLFLHCCTDRCWGLWCPWMPAVLPPPFLLTEPISTLCSFVSICLGSKALISHIQSRNSFVATTIAQKVSPHLLKMYYWTLSEKLLQSKWSFPLICPFIVLLWNSLLIIKAIYMYVCQLLTFKSWVIIFSQIRTHKNEVSAALAHFKSLSVSHGSTRSKMHI